MLIGYDPDYDYLFDPQQDPPGTIFYEEDKNNHGENPLEESSI